MPLIILYVYCVSLDKRGCKLPVNGFTEAYTRDAVILVLSSLCLAACSLFSNKACLLVTFNHILRRKSIKLVCAVSLWLGE